MDILLQNKLSKAEWISIEEPVSESEKPVLSLIRDGYENINTRINRTTTLFSITKLDPNPENDLFLFNKYFKQEIQNIIEKYGNKNQHFVTFLSKINSTSLKKLKSMDMIRIQNLDTNIQNQKTNIFEFILIDFCKKICKSIKKTTDYALYLYSMIQWKKNTIPNMNSVVSIFMDAVILYGKSYISLESIFKNAYSIIEKNPYLFQYEDLTLFSHQKELFSFCEQNKDTPKLILYIAPTGTGKTLSPIGLSKGYRIIFVCVARHIGLALAKSAISVDKKVAFAFGCETASDIRLHYFSAIEYSTNKRSGGIGKVDNSVGNNVEIMICDVQSYLIAMYYMLAFNTAETILTYWDEPTMTLDYETHPLHEKIHQNWTDNKIPNMVLSCATLPKEHEIQDVLQDFRSSFMGAIIHTITSFDCRKSIPILNSDGICVSPHMLCETLEELQVSVKYCTENKTLLRYFDLQEIIRFILYLHEKDDFTPLRKDDSEDNISKTRKIIQDTHRISNYFKDISDITMNSLKIYYLSVLSQISPDHSEQWLQIHTEMKMVETPKFQTYIKNNGDPLRRIQSVQEVNNVLKPIPRMNSAGNVKEYSTKEYLEKGIMQNMQKTHPNQLVPEQIRGILLTTNDAYTLTDGPTLYLADDVLRIGLFYIQYTRLPDTVLQQIMSTITKNEEILEKINTLEIQLSKKLQVKDNSDKKTESVGSKKKGASKTTNERSGEGNDESESLMDNITNLRSMIRIMSMEPKHIPNTIPHQMIWTPTNTPISNAFSPSIPEQIVKEIMELEIDKTYKILALLGIGILIKQPNAQYEEIIKRLAHEQRLYLVLASSDFVYGTNYQFCHGFIGKDLKNMTAQKTLQAMGRVGRNNIQQEYTIRFRDDEMIRGLFRTPEINMEAVNMCRLFCHE